MAYRGFYGFKPYVPVRVRRAHAARELTKLEKKGRQVSPVVIEGRQIARTFWGEAWCDNLERYSDFANRLPRGRTYARNGSVVDLQITSGRVTALVSGSSMYTVNVAVEPVPRARWRDVCKDCSGAIDSVIELLQGRLSQGVMTRICDEKTGLFPSPREIRFTCSCPDWASMCKHVAAVLYGIGARLDHQPELLFTLRNVDQQDLIAKAGSDLSTKGKQPAGSKILESDDLSAVFGIEMASSSPPEQETGAQATVVGVVPAPRTTTKRSAAARSSTRQGSTKKRTASIAKMAPTVDVAKPEPKRPSGQRGMTPTQRRAVAERMRRYWAERRAAVAKGKRR